MDSIRAYTNGKMVVADVAQVFLAKNERDISLKPRTKMYYRMLLGFIDRSWPGLYQTDVREVNARDCEEWLAK